MSISPVHRIFVNLVWWPSLADIRSGAVHLFGPLRRSWLLVQNLFWLPRLAGPAPPWQAVPSADEPAGGWRLSASSAWPVPWPEYVIEIESVACTCPPPMVPPSSSLVDLLI